MNVLIGLTVMAVCLTLQSLLVALAIRYYSRHEHLVSSASFGSTLIVIISVMTVLVIGNIAQVGLWAVLFQTLGEFQQFEAAFYHSAVNFSSLGYGDIVMSDEHKVLGPLEAINGVLMIGVSTAVLMAAFQDALRKRSQARQS